MLQALKMGFSPSGWTPYLYKCVTLSPQILYKQVPFLLISQIKNENGSKPSQSHTKMNWGAWIECQTLGILYLPRPGMVCWKNKMYKSDPLQETGPPQKFGRVS